MHASAQLCLSTYIVQDPSLGMLLRAGLPTSINAIKYSPQACPESRLPWNSSFCQDDNYITPRCWIRLIFLQCSFHSLHPVFESNHLGTKISCRDFKALLIIHWKRSQKVEQDDEMAGTAD